jgi:uncharacterized membrane protein YdbT with pleckstrin-like domain
VKLKGLLPQFALARRAQAIAKMFIVENYNSKRTKWSWIWIVILMLLFFHGTALTMHIHYNPSPKKKAPTPPRGVPPQ